MNIMLSIKPSWANKILSGTKTIEVRRSFMPTHEPEGNERIYIYSSLPVQKVVARFRPIYPWLSSFTHQEISQRAGYNLTKWELENCDLIGITDLEVFDKPMILSQFGITKPPQNWCYIKSTIPEIAK